MKRRMHLIRWTASPNLSMSGCTSISNGQLTRWWSARPGLREMGPLMAAQFQWGMPTSALILYLIRSITRCTLITLHRKTGNALFRTRVLMWPSASASLSLITNCIQMMVSTTANLRRLEMITHHLPTEEITLPSLVPCHHPREDRSLLLFLLVLYLHQPQQKRRLLLLLPLHQPQENLILIVLLLHNRPKQDLGHPRSRRKGPRIRSLMLPKWTNKKRKG